MHFTNSAAIQDEMPANICWGCGPDNAHGLRLKSYWRGDTTVARYQPKPYQAGWPWVLNGGILASLIDCHCVCTAIAEARRAPVASQDGHPPVVFATGSLSVRYLRPVPIDATLELTARITERTPRTTRLECTVTVRGEPCAQAEVVAVRVMSSLDARTDQAVA